jgi:hypothetical protein
MRLTGSSGMTSFWGCHPLMINETNAEVCDATADATKYRSRHHINFSTQRFNEL